MLDKKPGDAFMIHRAAQDVTPRQLECLGWAALGKNSHEIARILNITSRTVDAHLYNISVRLGVRGRQAAITRAAVLKLLSLAEVSRLK